MPARPRQTAGYTPSSTNLYVRNVHSQVDDVMLRDVFAAFGKITSSMVMRDIRSGRSLGTAFVRFEKHEEAQAALSAMHRTPLKGRTLNVQWAKQQHDSTPAGEERKKMNKLFLRNVPLDVSAAGLGALVRDYGTVTKVTVHEDTITVADPRRRRRIAFVTFAEEGAAEAALHAVHTTCPFRTCNGVPLLCKLSENYAAKNQDGEDDNGSRGCGDEDEDQLRGEERNLRVDTYTLYPPHHQHAHSSSAAPSHGMLSTETPFMVTSTDTPKRMPLCFPKLTTATPPPMGGMVSPKPRTESPTSYEDGVSSYSDSTTAAQISPFRGNTSSHQQQQQMYPCGASNTQLTLPSGSVSLLHSVNTSAGSPSSSVPRLTLSYQQLQGSMNASHAGCQPHQYANNSNSVRIVGMESVDSVSFAKYYDAASGMNEGSDAARTVSPMASFPASPLRRSYRFNPYSLDSPKVFAHVAMN